MAVVDEEFHDFGVPAVVEERDEFKLGSGAKTGRQSGDPLEECHRLHTCIAEVLLENVGDELDEADLEQAEQRVELSVMFVNLATCREPLLLLLALRKFGLMTRSERAHALEHLLPAHRERTRLTDAGSEAPLLLGDPPQLWGDALATTHSLVELARDGFEASFLAAKELLLLLQLLGAPRLFNRLLLEALLEVSYPLAKLIQFRDDADVVNQLLAVAVNVLETHGLVHRAELRLLFRPSLEVQVRHFCGLPFALIQKRAGSEIGDGALGTALELDDAGPKGGPPFARGR